jgi:hypothetical protein
MATSFLGRTDLDPGLRNNNPGNIKDDGTAWLGKVGSDGTFVIFSDLSWGVRAMAKAITTMFNKGANTIRLLINEWAPPSENSTDAYVAAVAADTGQGADDLLQLDQPTLHDLIRAIINHENGAQAVNVPDADIDAGIGMAQGGLTTYAQAASIAVTGSPDNSTAMLIGAGLLLAVLLYVAYDGD